MVAPMARRLVAAGREVTVWNRTPRAVEGAATAASPAEAVADADLVVTVLRDPAAVEGVLADAAPGLRDGAPQDLERCREVLGVFGTVREAGGRGPGTGRTGVGKVNPASVPATNGLYSHATRAGNLLSVSGQVALDADGNVVGEGDMTRQAEHVMESLARILADQGCTFDDVTHIRTFVTDMSLLPEYGAVRRRFITGEPPASTTVEVSRLFRPGLLIEAEVTAVVPGAV
ncbi:hypothetical protein GCM10010466_66860 [Planomonospora alba]|uniref:6-phosphogluconate dehydrogenase NADP-binding domain-containing protein n=2 Tax=Planomonospora alba TaxID=161354 RepID=A0ABP6P468_9ACTN